ncbi:nitrite reductase, putative [Babesia ovata]|uniref:Nitrite reductase, putative n=1 Tax=Babesia ovata TaxID=189622 RepID=A0A2H6K6E1_9APIC|nr:nitrite reductase, putative [Babesia ovata]GBE58557.1 nitrite reductase, putative [Babesia ovata]
MRWYQAGYDTLDEHVRDVRAPDVAVVVCVQLHDELLIVTQVYDEFHVHFDDVGLEQIRLRFMHVVHDRRDDMREQRLELRLHLRPEEEQQVLERPQDQRVQRQSFREAHAIYGVCYEDLDDRQYRVVLPVVKRSELHGLVERFQSHHTDV